VAVEKGEQLGGIVGLQPFYFTERALPVGGPAREPIPNRSPKEVTLVGFQ
jgi:hypothetical protein